MNPRGLGVAIEPGAGRGMGKSDIDHTVDHTIV